MGLMGPILPITSILLIILYGAFLPSGPVTTDLEEARVAMAAGFFGNDA
jgi:hypothetical protein